MLNNTNKIGNMTVEDLNQLIEQKLIEIVGDPDSGLELKDDFKEKLKKRLKSSSKRVLHQEVIKRFA
ncbi:MAG: hypothetical protein M1276_07240 [Deltaproteobacteria bacterium]|jgi:hypothetical protein|nr:hypothetical protein [Deltaproteobacteria bacterium]